MNRITVSTVIAALLVAASTSACVSDPARQTEASVEPQHVRCDDCLPPRPLPPSQAQAFAFAW